MGKNERRLCDIQSRSKMRNKDDPQNSRLPISFPPPKSRNARRNGNRLRSEKYGYIRVFIVAVMGNARGELAYCLWPRRAPTRTVESAAMGACLAAIQHRKDASSSRFLGPFRHPIRRRVVRSPSWRIVWCLAAKNRAAGEAKGAPLYIPSPASTPFVKSSNPTRPPKPPESSPVCRKESKSKFSRSARQNC